MQTRAKGGKLTPLNPELERTVKQIRAERRMADRIQDVGVNPEGHVPNNAEIERTLQDLANPLLDGLVPPIRVPAMTATNFELKPVMFNMLQTKGLFHGLPSENPNSHLVNFLQVCSSFKHQGVTDDAFRLQLFPFSLAGDASIWLDDLGPGAITTWVEMAQAFLSEYFPPGKAAQLRNEITSFQQKGEESLHDAWLRYKKLLRLCPHHGLAPWVQIQTFYNGLFEQTQSNLDAAAGGTLMEKNYTEAKAIIEKMAAKQKRIPGERSSTPMISGVHVVDSNTAIAAQMATLSKNIQQLTSIVAGNVMRVQSKCECCGEQHATAECPINPESVNYVGGTNQNNPYSNTYDPGWRNHPNFRW